MPGLDVSKCVAAAGVTPGDAAHGYLVEHDEQGIPWRASSLTDSPYYCPASLGLVLTIDGRLATPKEIGLGVFGFNRREGWIEGDLVDGLGAVIIPHQSRRRYGRVVVFWPHTIGGVRP